MKHEPILVGLSSLWPIAAAREASLKCPAMDNPSHLARGRKAGRMIHAGLIGPLAHARLEPRAGQLRHPAIGPVADHVP